MEAFSTGLTAVGLRLLTTYGEAITVTRDVITSFSPANGTVSDGVDITYTGYGYPENYNNYSTDGLMVQQGDIKLTFSTTTQPLVNDIFTVGSVDYTALNVERITAQGSNIIYIVQLRK